VLVDKWPGLITYKKQANWRYVFVVSIPVSSALFFISLVPGSDSL
jgi:hypothetical protein